MFACSCPGCRRKIPLKEEYFGRKLKCKCGRAFRAPQKPAIAQAEPVMAHAEPVVSEPVMADVIADVVPAESGGGYQDPLGLPLSDFPDSPPNASKFETRYNNPSNYQNHIQAAPKIKTIREAPRRRGGGGFSLDGPIITGILMMIGAAVWFVLGLQAGHLFYYPPVLFLLGLASIVRGLVDL